MPRRHPHLTALLGYLALALAATWPLAARFGSEIGGDLGDAWQTVWGFWWWRFSLFHLHIPPTFCPWLRAPGGIPMWFQTWDLPAALAGLPLWGLVPEVSVYNAVIFASYPLAGFTLYLLARELWGDELAAWCAGALYTVSTYHFGHALGHPHIVSMEWSPLYFLGLVRTLRHAGWKGPVLAGVGLSLAATASFYHLMFCFLATLVLFAAWLATDRAALLSRGFWQRALVLAGVFALLAGWLYAGMLRAHLSEPYSGAHDAVWFSADLQSFFMPNAASAWAGRFGAWRRWTGNNAESAGYVGYVALWLALLGAWHSRAARPWLLVAAAGFVVALGPFLHVGGVVHRGVMLPYGWLVRAVPLLEFTGVPTRFSWLVTFGVAVAAGAALAQACRRGRLGRGLALAATALALAESWPHAFVTSRWPTPEALFRSWAKDPEPWLVLDATDPQRALWDQVLHHHPQVGGYVTRAPARLEKRLYDDPPLRAFFGRAGPLQRVEALVRVDPGVDFDWADGSPAPGLPPDGFTVRWTGTLLAPQAGDYRLSLASDDGALLTLDGRPVVDDQGAHALRRREATVHLAAGPHSLALDYVELSGEAEVHLGWTPPGGAPSAIPAGALRSEDGKPGLTGRYAYAGADLGMPRELALQRLEEMKVRYVVVDGARLAAARTLGGRQVYEGEGLSVFELPAAPP